MNSYFSKAVLAFFISLIQFQTYSQNTYYTIGSGTLLFNNSNNWNTQTNGLGTPPSVNELTGTTPAHFVILNPASVSFTNVTTTLASLKVGFSCTAFLENSKITITGDANFDTDAVIDFQTTASTLTIEGNMNGGMGSTIRQAPNLQVTQNLILKGLVNTLDIYENWLGTGTCVVSYEGANQYVFAEDYTTLVLAGTGVKELKAESFNPHSNITVSQKLNLGAILKLTSLNLTYSGDNNNLIYGNSNGVTGWVWTDGSGSLINSSQASIQTFPVGDNVTMKGLNLSAISSTSNLIVGVRYNASEPNTTISPNGVGIWLINTNKTTDADITLINPIPVANTLSTPKIALSTTGKISSWSTLSTTKPQTAPTDYVTNGAFIQNGNNYTALFDCSPTISPSTLASGEKNVPYSQNLQLASDRVPYNLMLSSTLPADPAPTNLHAEMTSGAQGTMKITGTPIYATDYNVRFTIKDGYSCETEFQYNINIIEYLSPNLAILNIGPKTYGDVSFKVHTYSRSNGTITYSIVSGTCATIDPASGVITILDAGPSPQNIIVVKATQAALGIYKAESATETFIIKPATGKFIVLNNAFLVNQPKAISVFSRLDVNPTLTFDQYTGFDKAIVQPNGMVIPSQAGEFTVHISMAATNKHTAFDSVYTFNVIMLQKPPIAMADTIVLEMGKDSTFNILDNDLGMNQEIAFDKTDIDIENSGIQTKFYSTELGNFLIDANGNLTILPFSGFIGSGRLGYTIADANGLQSEIAYVEILVNAPYVIPELKVNDVMTPNGDNLNDALVIANTDLNKENSLIIIDEIGNTVYETTNYQNNWEGVDQKNNKLAPGIYFYIFKENNSGRELENYIRIVR